MTADTTALQPHATGTGSAGHDAASGVHAGRGVSNVILGMVLFITSEVMFFSGLFAAYFSTRFSATHVPWPPDAFDHILDPLGLNHRDDRAHRGVRRRRVAVPDGLHLRHQRSEPREADPL